MNQQQTNKPNMSTSSLSIYIPRVFANITKDRVAQVFKSLSIGEVSYIDFVAREDANTGEPYNMAFIHFSEWYDNTASKNFQEKVNDPNHEAKIVYDDPWYWMCLPNTNPKPDSQRIMENHINTLYTYIHGMHGFLMQQHQTINWMVNRVTSLENGWGPMPLQPPALVRQTNEYPEDWGDSPNCVQDAFMSEPASVMEEGEMPEWYNQDVATNTFNIQNHAVLTMEQIATNTAEFVLDQNNSDDNEYLSWKFNNPPLNLPLTEGQVQEDQEGVLWVFTDCNDEPVWRRINKDDSRYEQFKKIYENQKIGHELATTPRATTTV